MESVWAQEREPDSDEDGDVTHCVVTFLSPIISHSLPLAQSFSLPIPLCHRLPLFSPVPYLNLHFSFAHSLSLPRVLTSFIPPSPTSMMSFLPDNSPPICSILPFLSQLTM